MSAKALFFLAAVAPLAAANGVQMTSATTTFIPIPTVTPAPSFTLAKRWYFDATQEEAEQELENMGIQPKAASELASALFQNKDFQEGIEEVLTQSAVTTVANDHSHMIGFLKTSYPMITNAKAQVAVSSIVNELLPNRRRDATSAAAAATPTFKIGTPAEAIAGDSPSQVIANALASATSVIGTSAEGQEGGSPNDSGSANPLAPTTTVGGPATGTETAASSITPAVVAGGGFNPTPADVILCAQTATDSQGQVTGSCAQIVASFTKTFNPAGPGSASASASITGTDSSSASASASASGSAEVTAISTESSGSTLFATIQPTDVASTFASSVSAAPSGVAAPSGGLSSGFTFGSAPLPTIAAGAAPRSGVTMGAMVAAVAGAAFFL